jgi:hypothetical protein
VDGTIGALKIMVDGERPLFYHPDQRSARWNQQILKFAPHFDSLLSAVYVFDSTHNHLSYTSVDVNDLGIDSQGNLYINLMGHNVSSSLMVSNSDSLTVDITANKPTMMIKYTPNLRAIRLAQLSNIGDSSEYIQTNILYSHIDESTNSIFLSGSVGWPRSFSVNGVLYNNDTLDISNNDAYWIRLNMDNLELLSYGKAQAGEGGIVFEPMLATQHNRVFAQTNFSKSISFNDATLNIPNTGGRDNIFLVWDNEGHELSAIDYNSFNPDNLYFNPIVIDSVVYLIGTLYSNATFDTFHIQTNGNSVAYIARYVDTAFLTPYTPIDTTHTDPIDTGSVRITVVGDEGAFVAYPNPFRQRVVIEMKNEELRMKNGIVTAILTDLSGRREELRLTPDGPGQYSLDLTSRPQATYLLTLTTADGKQHTVRLLKQSDIFVN